MIACFPDPYPDELLFSVCARFDAAMMYPDRGTAVRRMFGVEYAAVSIDLPNRIDYLTGSLLSPHDYTADGLIDDHTLLPFYAPFVPPERALAVRGEMRGSVGNHVYGRLGITSGSLKRHASLRFCPECVTADRKWFGETYWHRVHQLPGIEVCPRHVIFLESGAARWRNTKNRCDIMTAERAVYPAVSRQLDMTDRRHAALLRVAQGAAWLLAWCGRSPGAKELSDRYNNMLLRRGLAYYNGRIRSGELKKKFIEFYTPALLESLRCSIGDQNNHWLMRLVRQGRVDAVQHPFRHLLLMTFLGVTPEEVFTRFVEFKPFGDGPWPCLNKASEHYRQPRAAHCRIEDGSKKTSGKPVGTFTCECGFSYTRSGPDLTDEDRYKSSSTQSYGPIWEKSLREWWADTSVTIREVARRLGVNELTVKRRAISLGLIYPRNTPGSLRASGEILKRYRIASKPLNEEVAERRARFVALRQAHPQAGRLQLQQLAVSLLDWLRRYDGAWLEEHLPPVAKSHLSPVRVDWESWDVKLADEVKAAAFQIRQTDGFPVRVSLKAIVAEVGHRAWFEKNLDRLPLTAQAISHHLESFEHYLLRKVKWAEDYYRRQAVIPTLHHFEVCAGTRGRKGRTQTVQEAIGRAMRRLSLESN